MPTQRFRGYEPLSTEEWARLQRANVVAGIKTALPVGYGGGGIIPTPTYSASISPSSAIQYDNVILTGSTDLSNPVFVWTLTDFYDVSGNTITTYTGQTLTQGYFGSTSGSVSLSVTGDEGSASSSTFTITSWSPTSLTNIYNWYDMSDEATISTRSSGGSLYITEVSNKGYSSNITKVSQTTAANQPVYTSGDTTFNTGLKYADYTSLSSLSLDSDAVITGRTHDWFVVFKSASNLTPVNAVWSVRNGINPIYNLYTESGALASRYRDSDVALSQDWTYIAGSTSTGYVLNTPYDFTLTADATRYLVNGKYFVNGVEKTTSIFGQTINADAYLSGINTTLRLGNQDSLTTSLNGLFGEMIMCDEIVDSSTRNRINRYLLHKWIV